MNKIEQIGKDCPVCDVSAVYVTRGKYKEGDTVRLWGCENPLCALSGQFFNFDDWEGLYFYKDRTHGGAGSLVLNNDPVKRKGI